MTLTLDEVRNLLSTGKYELTSHALHRVVERNIAQGEIQAAGASAELIEDYPTDKYGPSSLLFGLTVVNRPLHIHVSRTRNVRVRIITLYEPRPDEWIDYRSRRIKP